MINLCTVEKSSYYWEEKPIVDIQNNVENKKLNAVDLFCGAGGIGCGMQMTKKFNIILANDIYAPAIETYKYNHPNTSTILGNIKNISDETFKQIIGKKTIDLVSAGVPCQGFSLANKKRNKDDERNYLFLEVVRFVNIFNPKVVMIENVSGMKSLNNGSFVEDINESLQNSGKYGYIVQNTLVNAADYGVPQLRNRLVFIAVRKDIGKKFNFPKATHGINTTPFNTIYDAISDLPELENNEEKINYTSNSKTNYQKFLRNNEKNLLNHKSPKHPSSTVERIKNTKPGLPMYEKYKQRIRLAWNIQSPTQVAGGIRPQFQFGHPEQNRGLTIRERARIQSFPDNYKFLGGIVQSRVQTGNAVPPLLAKAITLEIAKLLKI
jgi:DNA (cytosine-5)-methyltransferase 1